MLQLIEYKKITKQKPISIITFLILFESWQINILG